MKNIYNVTKSDKSKIDPNQSLLAELSNIGWSYTVLYCFPIWNFWNFNKNYLSVSGEISV